MWRRARGPRQGHAPPPERRAALPPPERSRATLDALAAGVAFPRTQANEGFLRALGSGP